MPSIQLHAVAGVDASVTLPPSKKYVPKGQVPPIDPSCDAYDNTPCAGPDAAITLICIDDIKWDAEPNVC